MSKRKVKAVVLSLYEIMEQYKTSEDALKYFVNLRWGDGEPVCVKCGCSGKITPQKKKGDYWCGDCRSYFNALTGTPMERTKIDLRKWIYAMYTLVTSRKGISSLQLSKELGVQQKTAWYILHRLRMSYDESNGNLSGTVEIDETYIGGKEKNKHRNKRFKHKTTVTGKVGKQPVLGMKERGGKIRAMPVKDVKAKTLLPIIRATIEKGSIIYTDDFGAYKDLTIRGGIWPFEYVHQSVNHSAKEYVNGMAHTNGIESVWAVLKRGFNGVYHNWSLKHCAKYVNEFSFRLSDGNCDRDTEDRLAALFKGMINKHLTYEKLVS